MARLPAQLPPASPTLRERRDGVGVLPDHDVVVFDEAHRLARGWMDEASISGWKSRAGHAAIRERGRWLWDTHFELRVTRVERAYGQIHVDLQ